MTGYRNIVCEIQWLIIIVCVMMCGLCVCVQMLSRGIIVCVQCLFSQQYQCHQPSANVTHGAMCMWRGRHVCNVSATNVFIDYGNVA